MLAESLCFTKGTVYPYYSLCKNKWNTTWACLLGNLLCKSKGFHNFLWECSDSSDYRRNRKNQNYRRIGKIRNLIWKNRNYQNLQFAKVKNASGRIGIFNGAVFLNICSKILNKNKVAPGGNYITRNTVNKRMCHINSFDLTFSVPEKSGIFT